MDTDEKRLLREQIVRIMFATNSCPDSPGLNLACPRCMATEITDAMEQRIDAERLAK
jgi:hypothetical protein